MEEDGEALSSPFWVPSSGNKRRRNDRIRHGLSSLIFNSGLLILLLLVTALSFLVFVVPSTLSFSAQIFKPNSVKKSWDSLNLILVVVALLLGFLCRNKNDEIVPDDDQGFQASTPVFRNEYRNGEASKSNQFPSPHKWYDYSDQNRSVYSTSVPSRDMFLRTSSSYPDLRQVPSPRMQFSDDPWRFSDDINWATGTGQFLRRRSWKDKSDEATNSVRFSDDIYWGTGGTGQRLPSWKEKTVETADVRSDKASTEINSREADVSSLIPSPPAPLPPPLPVMTSALPEEKPKRTNGDKRGRNRRRKDIEMESMEPISPVVAASPPPPPPPPPPMPQFVDPKSSKRSLKKRSGGSATKDFLNSLYHKKKKKQRQKSVDNFDSLLVNRYQQPSSQPPPPPPPTPPPPPPPVSPPVSFNRSVRKRKDAVISGSKTSQFLTVAVNIPPKAVAVTNYYGAEESSNSGGESPVIHIPPPPPPPPSLSKSLAWKFALQGDYVRVDSTESSRSVSPEAYDADSDRTPMAGDGGDATPMTTASSLFCPSPDVDTKADKFISNFWAGLKLEKIDSLNKKQGLGLSNLGPGSGPTKR